MSCGKMQLCYCNNWNYSVYSFFNPVFTDSITIGITEWSIPQIYEHLSVENIAPMSVVDMVVKYGPTGVSV